MASGLVANRLFVFTPYIGNITADRYRFSASKTLSTAFNTSEMDRTGKCASLLERFSLEYESH